MIRELAGVIFWTDNLDAMVAFYRDRLGLPIHSVRPHFVAFEISGVRVSVGLHSEVHGPAREAVRSAVHFTVDDLAAMHRDLSAQGVAFLRPPEREHWGGLIATLRDPDGNLIQLLEQP